MSNVISCVSWVKCGISANQPSKYVLNEKELERVTRSEAHDADDNGDEDAWVDEEDASMEVDGMYRSMCLRRRTILRSTSWMNTTIAMSKKMAWVHSAILEDLHFIEITRTIHISHSKTYGCLVSLLLASNTVQDPEHDERSELEILPTDNLLAIANTEDDISQLEISISTTDPKTTSTLSTPHSRFSPSHTNPLLVLYRVDLFPTPSRSYFLPNQMDQSSRRRPNFRTFFPYIPNEVKHRKCTSRIQLKVLEDIFRKDTKPNAALRNKLAAELDMLPRAVQVWFQNRRAKDKALRNRVQDSTQQDSPSAHSPQKSQSSRDTSPNDSSNSSTPTEKPTPLQKTINHPHQSHTHPLTKFSFSLPAPPTEAWHSNLATPAEIPPHVRHLPVDLTWQDNNDLLNTRRGSLPITASTPSTDANQPPSHFPDRRKSMDVSLLRFMHHPFARVAKEKNDAIFLRPPISPAGSGQSMARPPSGLGAPSIRATSYSCYTSYNPHTCPSSAHRASEPHVFSPTRSSLVPEIRPPFPSSHVPRQLSDNRFTMSSRALPSPIPGPLPKPDFQVGAPTSGSPPHVSPDAEFPWNLHAWAFPRNEADQDTEDSNSSTGLSRFGSIASICGSDTSATSAIYSDVSSCVGVDHFDSNGRKGSCASNLETRMSGLNMRSSQGSLNEAHSNAASSFSYQHREHLSSQEPGYSSPTSTVSPGGSPHSGYSKDPGPSGLRTSEVLFGYSPLPPETSANTYLDPMEPTTASRRLSIPTIQEGVLHNHIQNNIEHNSSYPTPVDTTAPSNVYYFAPESNQYFHTGNYPPSPRDGTFPPTETSYAQPGLQMLLAAPSLPILQQAARVMLRLSLASQTSIFHLSDVFMVVIGILEQLEHCIDFSKSSSVNGPAIPSKPPYHGHGLHIQPPVPDPVRGVVLSRTYGRRVWCLTKSS
ncbi:uncharacterized protein F5891DRAFT_1255166 [Suillus fuscotomentosus]|uniref:Homeobox domain-containing protein n=1 Tax=Suillus fuscotomentosus TaxID=1912939 RepID=A0AAD4DV60_9AGAM|nr:uncharacterized protein F5891DRAFT_1255166 [Suillus fuscotomentosus]KAG1894475.1 hypothetical protein F5891DRAFT_1255166 [Suillus fuscotomentosus]